MATQHPPIFGSGDAFSKVEVSVTCQNLKDLDYFSKSDPCVFLFELVNRNWSKLGRTEVIDNNLNPQVSAFVSSLFSTHTWSIILSCKCCSLRSNQWSVLQFTCCMFACACKRLYSWCKLSLLTKQFSKHFQLQYRFEEIQKLKFVVVDIDDKSRIDDLSKHDLIGELECTLADLVTAGQQYERTLRLKGEMMLT